MHFMYDKSVTVKRYESSLGEFNRPQKKLIEVGVYECHIAQTSSTVTQKAVQKENTEELDLYVDPEVPIKLGDIVYIYELDEYDKPIPETEYRAIADKPYKKRTHLQVPLRRYEEV